MNKLLVLAICAGIASGCNSPDTEEKFNSNSTALSTSTDNLVGTWVLHSSNYKVDKDAKNKIVYISKMRGTEETYLLEFRGGSLSMIFSKRDANTLESVNTEPDIIVNINRSDNHIVIKYLDAEKIWAEYRKLK